METILFALLSVVFVWIGFLAVFGLICMIWLQNRALPPRKSVQEDEEEKISTDWGKDQ